MIVRSRVRGAFCASLGAAFLAAAPVQAESETQTDTTVVQGSVCQATYASQASRLTHNVDWLSNGSSGSAYVTCPLVRQSNHGLADPTVRVRVFRPQGAGPLDCLFHVRAVTNESVTVHGSAVVGWSYVEMTPPRTFNGASYAVRCLLPPGARLQKLVLEE